MDPRVERLLDALADAGLDAGPTVRARLIAVLRHGDLDPDDLGRVLIALAGRSEDDAHTIDRVVRQWSERLTPVALPDDAPAWEPARLVPPPAMPPAPPGARARRWLRRHRTTLLRGGPIVIVLLLLFSQRDRFMPNVPPPEVPVEADPLALPPDPTPTPVPEAERPTTAPLDQVTATRGPLPTTTAPWLAALAFALLALALAAARSIQRRPLHRPASVRPRPPTSGLRRLPPVSRAVDVLSVDERGRLITGIGALLSELPTRRLDTLATVRDTARAAGRPVLRWRRARVSREVCVWLDEGLMHGPIGPFADDVVRQLLTVGLPASRATFRVVPDALLRDDGSTLAAGDINDRLGSARVAVFLDPFLVRAQLARDGRKRVEACLRELQHADGLIVVAPSDEAAEPLRNLLAPWGLTIVGPREAARRLADPDQRGQARPVAPDVTLWATTLALTPGEIADATAIEIAHTLGLNDPGWALGALRERLRCPDGPLRVEPDLRQELLADADARYRLADHLPTWVASALDRLLAAAEADLLAHATVPGWRGSAAEADDALHIALLHLWRDPKRAAPALSDLHARDPGTAARVREELGRLTPRDLPAADPARLRLPWDWTDQGPALRAELLRLGLHLPNVAAPDLRPPARWWVASGLLAGAGLALVVSGLVPRALPLTHPELGLRVQGAADVWLTALDGAPALMGPVGLVPIEGEGPALTLEVTTAPDHPCDTTEGTTRTLRCPTGNPTALAVALAPTDDPAAVGWANRLLAAGEVRVVWIGEAALLDPLRSALPRWTTTGEVAELPSVRVLDTELFRALGEVDAAWVIDPNEPPPKTEPPPCEWTWGEAPPPCHNTPPADALRLPTGEAYLIAQDSDAPLPPPGSLITADLRQWVAAGAGGWADGKDSGRKPPTPMPAIGEQASGWPPLAAARQGRRVRVWSVVPGTIEDVDFVEVTLPPTACTWRFAETPPPCHLAGPPEQARRVPGGHALIDRAGRGAKPPPGALITGITRAWNGTGRLIYERRLTAEPLPDELEVFVGQMKAGLRIRLFPASGTARVIDLDLTAFTTATCEWTFLQPPPPCHASPPADAVATPWGGRMLVVTAGAGAASGPTGRATWSAADWSAPTAQAASLRNGGPEPVAETPYPGPFAAMRPGQSVRWWPAAGAPVDLMLLEAVPDTNAAVRWVRIPATSRPSWRIGSPESESDDFAAERPTWWVKFTADFEMMSTEATNAQVRAALADPSWAEGEDPKWPAANITQIKAREVCRKLGGDLPTEAEWEVAARAGTETAYWWGDTFDEARAWRNGQRNVVGDAVRTNRWYLSDMSGNVWEWTASCWTDDYKLPQLVDNDVNNPSVDVTTPTVGRCERAVLRGGSSWHEPWDLRSAFRFFGHPSIEDEGIGFRCVRGARRQSPVDR